MTPRSTDLLPPRKAGSPRRFAAALAAAGAQVRRGTLDDLAVLRSQAAGSDGVIHLAFKHDLAFSGGFQDAALADRRAVEALGDALAGTGRPLVIASGLLGIAPGRVATEEDGRDPAEYGGLGDRHATARRTLSLASRGVRPSVMRLAPTVHGDGDNGFMAMLIATARQGRLRLRQDRGGRADQAAPLREGHGLAGPD
ncbi:hypothetical protein AGRA3207_007173 [Actinomadura graeca]|uniref:Uncharacterized protein n=1 Tax=Actinomadura graeca TaxID=2750812 RepID=A0ABX8R3N1_9ACTN|nr:hypothetical protein [Actinomadura graeca]QXJ25652.1 hypothetical protein AGRA3207_007173 [Actinomadura graeca]